ncbi:TetR/AcrR family transcriptional regulator [Antrihabitans sp. YC3-6]|uniref:TetR/AcrR family transcriptional regulator n=1 Tax=Antrihabitans stalagmiti TaxID=2799499 RepID=A0A934U2S6_9NOCA|nr:TetR/AcrR family transcriptional regulator [Antrihabitans stalagmiti]MBJ8339106.1 TetR/AcrR family transcriptional regulator [Antrihabitans stalagmiti]
MTGDTTDADVVRPRRGRPKQEGLAERRREQIVQSAYHVFAANGYESTTISDVARHAGVGQGTVYRYFESKREILDHVFDYAAGQFVGVIMTDDLMRPIDSLDEFSDRLVDIAKRMAATLEVQPDLLKLILVEASAADAELNARMLGLEGFLAEAIARVMQDGQEKGWVRAEVDTAMYSHYVIALVMPGVRHAILGTLTPTVSDRFATATVAILAAALRVPETTAS